MPAGATLQADIRAQAGHRPLVTAAWMRFAQTDDIVELQVGEHVKIISNATRKAFAHLKRVYRVHQAAAIVKLDQHFPV